MKIALIYFTGTYNTKYLSLKIKEKLTSFNNVVDLFEINQKTQSIDFNDYDMLGIGYPIHAFNSPRILNKYLRTLPNLNNKNYFIYKNSGETFALNNSSSRVVKRILKKKEGKLIGEYHYVMPYNIHFPFDKSFIKEILIMNNKLIDLMIYKINNQIDNKIKSNIFYNFLSFVISIQKIGGPINSFFYKVEKDKCSNCKKCINNCPVKNIYIKENKIKFKHHCTMCMRCSFTCPNKAIKIGFLEGWKVTSYYDFEEISNDKTITLPYISKDNSKGFYKCFSKTFSEINSEYEKYISQN